MIAASFLPKLVCSFAFAAAAEAPRVIPAEMLDVPTLPTAMDRIEDGTVYFEDGQIVNGFPNAFDASVTVGTPGDPVDDFILLDMNFFVDNVVGSLG